VKPRSKRRSFVSASTAVVSLLAGAVLVAQQPAAMTVREQARETGSFERVVISESDPLQLADLVVGADLIVEASTAGAEGRMNRAETDIYTDYPFELHAVLKNSRRPEVRPSGVVTVRRNSGVVFVDGRMVVAQENDFPLFEPGEHYILFLTKLPRENAYSVFGGPQGAFISVQGHLKQLSIEFGELTHKRGTLARAAFLDEVRALLRFSS